MAFAVLEASKRSEDIPFVEKLFDYAMRNKRGNRGRTVYDILLGMKMINTGKYAEAAEQLKKYRSVDVIICPAIAYCHFVLSTQQTPVERVGVTPATQQYVACRTGTDDRTHPAQPSD